MSRQFFAPGKVVVIGEYAVTDGAPAIVAAVDHGVAVRWTSGPSVEIHTPGGDDRFVAAALRAVGSPPGRWTFEDQPARRSADKPGLGGSAAATVVATFAAMALAHPASPPDRAAVWRLAARVHFEVQGSGSGVDVAASAWGGFCRFELGAPPAPVPATPLSVVWSGASAATGPRLAAYRAWPQRHRFVDESRALTHAFAADPIAATRASRRLLEAMAADAGLDYRTPALDHLADLAERHGGAGKPSGAGGGDCLVALLPDPDARAAFEAAARRDGFGVIDARLSSGVHERTQAA